MTSSRKVFLSVLVMEFILSVSLSGCSSGSQTAEAPTKTATPIAQSQATNTSAEKPPVQSSTPEATSTNNGINSPQTAPEKTEDGAYDDIADVPTKGYI
jgi:hypothetical protein